MRTVARACIAITLLATSLPLAAQKHRDPLTPPEIDQIRDASWEPQQRLALYVQFARTRLEKLQQMRDDPKATDRPQQTHDLLDDFQLLYDELNDNIDTYVDRRNDIRKPLRLIISADNEFQAKLRALKAADVQAAEYREYEFVLTTALDAVASSTEDHRKLLADQEDAAKHKKLNSGSSDRVSGRPE